MKIKICGMTNIADVQFCENIGADFLGMIRYSKSPRFVPDENVYGLLEEIPEGKRVYVDVEPSLDSLKEAVELGFDYFQLHFSLSVSSAVISEWSALVGKERLWLAPRLPEDEPFPKYLLPLADTFLVDTYQENAFGGSGETGDWDTFWALKETYQDKDWILAGGLAPDNVKDAMTSSGTQVIDVNSGVEKRPGVKDHEKVQAVFQAVFEWLDNPEERLDYYEPELDEDA